MKSPSPQISTLSASQQMVLLDVARGATITAATARAEVDRSTFYSWRKQPVFAEALAETREEFTATLRDQFQELEIVALLSLRLLMENDKTPPAVRLKAALAVLGQAYPAQPLRACLDRLQSTRRLPETAPAATEFDTIQQNPGDSPALPEPEAQSAEAEPSPQAAAPEIPLPGQSNAIQHSAIKTVPRGGPCPCGSGRKYKRCCGSDASPVLRQAA